MGASLLVQRLPALAANPRPPRTAAGELIDVMRNAHRFIATRANNHHIRNRDWTFPLGDTAFDLTARIGARMPLHHADVLYEDTPEVALHSQHAAGLALIATGNHFDGIFFFEIDPHRLGRFSVCDCHLNHLWRQGNDFHEFLVTQFPGHRSKYARADRLANIVDQDGGIGIEPDIGSILAARFLAHANDDA